MKKYLFTIALMFAAMTAAAQTFIVGNLGYTVTDSDTKSVVVTKAGELSGELTIPSTVTYENVTYTVTSIAKEGFSGTGITALTIPATVTTIGYYAFHGTNQLKKVTFSDGSDPINFGTGYERSFGTSDKEVYIGRDINRTGNYSNEPLFLNVTKATFGSKVTTIPGNIMSGQVNLATLVIGDGVKTIGNDAFKGVTDAAPQMSVTIGANVETIGDRAFQNCTALKSISLPSKLITIGEAAFENAGLTALTIPASVKEIKYYAFHGCGSLANIRFDDSDETIDFRTGYEYSFGDAGKEVYLGRNVKRTGNYSGNRLFNCVTKATIGPKMTEIGGSLFDGNVELAEVTIGNGVKTIGGYAFRNCGTSDDVEEFKVTMGANVDSMGVCAFQYCTKLKSIVIPSKLKDIPNQAFEYTGLTALTIPATVTSTGYYAFHGCGSIASLRIEDSNDPLTFYTGYEYSFGDTPKEVYLGRNINRTGNYAGNRLSNWVTKLTVGNQVTEIAYNLFNGNIELADVTIGSGVKTIGNAAFYNCGTAEGIEEMTVKMGTSVETINACAFQYCTTLKSITLPTTLTLISDQAFEWTGLTSLTIPSSVTELKYYAFHGCGSLAKITFADSDTPITFGSGYEYSFGDTDKEVYIGRNINRTGNYAGNRLFNCVSKLTIGDKVTEIVSSMFDGNVELAEVTIGKGVKSIGNYAFRNCGTHDDVEEMTVIMGTNVETINACAFQSCTKLQSITLPATLTLIGDQAFEWAGLTTLTIPASVTDIKYYAFHGCNNLAKITFDDTDTPVNFGTGYERSFGNTTKEVYMGRDIKRTGNYSGERLFDCISKLTVSDKVTEIGSSLFSGNVELASVTIGKRVKSLGNNAFYNCGSADGIEEMTVAMGDSVATIGNGAFKNCTKLKTITLPNTLTLISDQAFENAGLTTITIPASVTDIKYYAFHGCNALTNIYFEDSETPVNFVTGYERSFGDAEKEVYMGRDFKRTGNYAGERPFNKVKKVTFGPKVTEIGSSMFNLNELMNVVVPWLQPITITENVFSNTSYQNATLWVPSGTTPTYKAANVWKKFLKMDCAYFYVNLEATKGGTISAGELSASNGKASDLFDRETDVVVTIKADEGYELKSLTVNGTAVQPANGQYTIKNLLADQTVVATFGLINYNLKYNLAGGALPQSKTNPATYTMETETFTLVNPERAGYTFEGWTGTGLEAATKTVTITKGSMGNREYTATWKAIEYTISYDLAGGALPQNQTNPATYTVESNSITLVNPVREGYTFEGWTGTGLEGATKTVTIAKGSTGNRNYTATWKVIAYTISYDLAGGVLPQGMTNPTAYNVESNAITLINPVREGYTFQGWTGTGLEAATLTVTIAKGSMGNRSYTATWKQDDIPGPEPQPTMAQGILNVEELANMNTPRMNHQIMPVEGGIAVFGGHTTNFALTNTAERYSNGTWTTMDMPNPHDYAGSIVLSDGQLLLLAGMSSGSGVGSSNKADIYNPKTNEFTPAGNLVQSRSMCFADMTDSGNIYLMGTWYNSSNAIECYDQETKTFSKAADGFNAYMPYVFAMRGEKVAIIDGSKLAVMENGQTTTLDNDLLKEFPACKSNHDAKMASHKVAKYSSILVGHNKNKKQAVLLNIYDDATEGILVRKIADLPMTLPKDENTTIEYGLERTRVFCNPAENKIFIQTQITDKRNQPVIVEYTYPKADKLDDGSVVVYTVTEPLEALVDAAAWSSLPDGTFVSTGGSKNFSGNENYKPATNAYIYKLVGGVYCDVNGDGSVDVADIATVISVMAGDVQQFKASADVNGDGSVDVADIATIITRMAELARLQRGM